MPKYVLFPMILPILTLSPSKKQPVHALLPPTIQSAQRYRLQRTLLSVAFYLLCAVVIAFGAWHAFYPWQVFTTYLILITLTPAAFLLIIWQGWNLRFRDPSLTQAQILCAILICSYSMVHGGPFRGVFIFAYVIALLFGGNILTGWQLARLALFPVLAFPLVILIAARLYPHTVDWRMEVAIWFSMCLVLMFVVLLAGNLSRLRTRLKASNAELQLAMTKLTEMAVHDDLTGLYNRRYLLEMLEREKSRIDRGGGPAFCVCLFDLDHFKRVNDTYGHQGGDTVLRAFAKIAAHSVRSSDILARWGGEEFLLLLPHSSIEQAEFSVARINAELARTAFDGLGPKFRITVSVGIAQYQAGETIDGLIDRADQALYRAKQAGRNRMMRG